jgi:hypothetical protein
MEKVLSCLVQYGGGAILANCILGCGPVVRILDSISLAFNVRQACILARVEAVIFHATFCGVATNACGVASRGWNPNSPLYFCEVIFDGMYSNLSYFYGMCAGSYRFIDYFDADQVKLQL